MPTFLVKGPTHSEGLFKLSPEDLRHLTKVLRVRTGDSFPVLFPDGTRGLAMLKEVSGELQGFILEQTQFKKCDSELDLWIAVGMVRWPRMEWMIEKLTELGIQKITPLLLERSRIPNIEKISPHKIDRLKRISTEALKQCQRPRAPEIDSPCHLQEFFKKTTSGTSAQTNKIIFDETTEESILNPSVLNNKFSTILLVGPEGGFTDQERNLAHANGFKSVSIGQHPLRTETAVIYGASVLHCGSLKGRQPSCPDL